MRLRPVIVPRCRDREHQVECPAQGQDFYRFAPVLLLQASDRCRGNCLRLRDLAQGQDGMCHPEQAGCYPERITQRLCGERGTVRGDSSGIGLSELSHHGHHGLVGIGQQLEDRLYINSALAAARTACSSAGSSHGGRADRFVISSACRWVQSCGVMSHRCYCVLQWAGAWRRCCHSCCQNPPAWPAVKGDHFDMAELWFPVPPLAGDVVLLRPWREADVPGMVLAFSDPVMRRFSWRTTPYTETDARDYFAEQEEARLRGEGLNFALAEPRDQDVVLGAVSLYEVRLRQGCAAVGYWLAPEARGRGAATYAVRLLARWAFAELGLARLELTCGPDNEASQHVAERCGFSREGLLRSHVPFKGARRDSVIYSLLPGELR